MQTTNLTSTKKFDWLNENSRKFLAAGYLGDSLSAEERIANIAQRAEELGMISMLVDNGDRDPREMARSLRRLPSQPKPSEMFSSEILGGLNYVNRLAKRWLKTNRENPNTRELDRAPIAG